MAVVSERVLRMKQNFMGLHEQGYSIPEIAAKHNLSNPSVYRHLQEIADENGVRREDLLKIVRVPRTNGAFWDNHERKLKVDVEALKNGFDEAKSTVGNLVDMIDDILRDVKEDIEYAY